MIPPGGRDLLLRGRHTPSRCLAKPCHQGLDFFSTHHVAGLEKHVTGLEKKVAGLKK